MTVRERIPLASLTTLKLGGIARYVIECENIDDIRAAMVFAREHSLPWYVLGEGSNVLAADSGYEGIIIRVCIRGSEFEENGEYVRAIVGAGVGWDAFVRDAALRELWGVENLAGIPGLIGATPVQNIGAYGGEIKNVCEWVEVFDTTTDTVRRLQNEECAFAYRDSRFKREKHLIIVRVAFTLSQKGEPSLAYPDLQKAQAQGESLSTPSEIGDTVRRIRSGKFPDLNLAGTAGSFFKNPILTHELWEKLATLYPGLPSFPTPDGKIKVPLAWILDKILNLRGAKEGYVGTFGNQPIVITCEPGATAEAVSAFANSIVSRVFDATGITVEREVQTLG